MTPLKIIKRAWARASFATVIPVAAFAIGLVLALSFTALYVALAYRDHAQRHGEFGEQISRIAATELAEGNLKSLESLLATLVPDRAIVRDANGRAIAGSLDRSDAGPVRSFPIAVSGQTIATLDIASTKAFQPLMPSSLAVGLCVIVALIAALTMRLFARTASDYVKYVTDIVDRFSLRTAGKQKRHHLVFSEFRTLNVATIRTTRRLAAEIKGLREQARYDSRTGLLNEPSLNKCIGDALEVARYDRPSALLILELNDQGSINERVGSLYSDQVVGTVIAIVKRVVEGNERRSGIPTGSWLLASPHSDQIAILARDCGGRDQLATFVRDIQAELRNPIRIADRTYSVTLSGGLAMIPEDGDTVALVRQRADATLMELKRQGKRGFSFYSPKLERQRDAQLKLESELRVAIENDRFIPLFQPKVDLATGRICGAEALARWQLDNGRLVSPSVFIELAEETGLIHQIGAQIMRKACLEAASWSQIAPGLSIAVNVSPKQFQSDGLSQMILDSLAKSGLSPRQLEIEITESLAIQHPERVRSVLKPLRKLGIRLAIDDFGTGHSNLSTLTQLDFDVFKIDRQFVMSTPHDAQANAIVEMILSMASTLQMQIVGEGIEIEAQARFLKSKGCHIGQGFLYSPPVTAEALRAMIETQPFRLSRRSA